MKIEDSHFISVFSLSLCSLRLCGEFGQRNYSTIPEKVRVKNGLAVRRKLCRHYHHLNFVNDNFAACIGGNVCKSYL